MSFAAGENDRHRVVMLDLPEGPFVINDHHPTKRFGPATFLQEREKLVFQRVVYERRPGKYFFGCYIALLILYQRAPRIFF